MIACQETVNGYPTAPAYLAGIGVPPGQLGFDPMTMGLVAQVVPGLFKNASGGDANDAFFQQARGSTLLGERARTTGYIVGGVVAVGALGLLLYWMVK